MSNSKVNSIYESYRKNEITKERTISLLMEEVFNSPRYYGIGNLDEDQKSDFLIWNYKGINSLLDNFKSGTSSFLTYFTVTTRFQTKTWARAYAKKQAMQHELDIYHDCSIQENIISQEMYTAEPPIQYGDTCIQKKNLTVKHKTTLLILALKNYPYLTNRHYEQIPNLVGISKNKFYEYIESIHKLTQKNIEKFNMADDKLCHCYMKCKQYKNELINLNSEKCQYFLVKTKLERETKMLEKKRQYYKETKKRTIPKNTTIDLILNLSYGTSSRILKKATENLYEIKDILDRKDT